MKKFKSIMAFILSAALSFSPVTAMAYESDEQDSSKVSVQVNGEYIDFEGAEPVILNNRVYVPFRTVFEALDASVEFDEATKTVTAAKNNTNVTFTVGNKEVKVNNDGKEQSIKTDAASFITDNRTYIPVRFAAQAFNCRVGWDDMFETVIIVEKDFLSISPDVKFDIMDKYLKHVNKFSTDRYAISGTADLSALVDFGIEKLDLSGVFKIGGFVDKSKTNMDVVFEVDSDTFDKLMALGEVNDEEKAELEIFKKIDVSYIMDIESGKFYIKSDTVSKLMGYEESAWYLFDLKQLLEEENINFELSDLANITKAESFRELIENVYELMPLDDIDAVNSCTTFNKFISTYLSDYAFKKVGDEYVLSTSIDDDEMINIVFAVTMKDDNVDSSRISLKLIDDSSEVNVTTTQKGFEKTLDMSFNIENLALITLNGKTKYSITASKPVSSPSATDTVIDYTSLISDDGYYLDEDDYELEEAYDYTLTDEIEEPIE